MLAFTKQQLEITITRSKYIKSSEFTWMVLHAVQWYHTSPKLFWTSCKIIANVYFQVTFSWVMLPPLPKLPENEVERAALLQASIFANLGCFSKHDVDDSENVIWKCNFAFLRPFLNYSKTLLLQNVFEVSSWNERRQNWRFVAKCSRLLHKCKTDHFTSSKGREWL